MKIIREGKKKDWWVGKIGTCRKCDTQIEIEEGDNLTTMFDRNNSFASIPCPVCNGNIWVDENSPSANKT